MDLKNFATPIAADNQFVKVSIGGFAGSGKTKTASDFIIGCYKDMKLTKPVLFVDNEKGRRFLVPLFKKHGIETLVKDTVHLADVLHAMEFLRKGEIDFLFVDSLTKVWYQFCKDYKKKNHRRFMTLQDWGKVIPEWQHRFSDKYVEIEGNFIFTGRGGYTYDLEESEDSGKKQFVKSGVKMKLAGETPFEPDLNIWMQVEQEMVDGKVKQWRIAQIFKDRSGLIDGATFKNPKYDDFKPVVDYLMTVEKGAVARETDTTNLIPEEYSGEKEQCTILVENIYGAIEAKYPGTTKENKEKKSKIKQCVFDTYSDTEIKSKTLAQLQTGFSRISDIVNSDTGYDEMIQDYEKDLSENTLPFDK